MKSFWTTRPSSNETSGRIQISSPYDSDRKVEEGKSSFHDDRSENGSYVDVIRANVIKKSPSGSFGSGFPKWYGQEYEQNTSNGWFSNWSRGFCTFIITTVVTIRCV